MIRATAVAMLIAAVPGAHAQDEDRLFNSRTDVLAVQVPVHVVHDGKPLRGLTAGDFQVFEGRTRHTIVDFEMIDLGEVVDEPASPLGVKLPIAGRRHFLLLFDLSFSSPASVIKARQAAHEFVSKGLHATDLVAVATYAEVKGAELVLGFTADRAQLGAALESLGLLDPVQRKADPLKLVIQPGIERLVGEGGGRTLGPGDGGGPTVEGIILETIRDLSPFAERNERTEQINQILNLSGSLEELAGYLAATSGRKHVVFLSEGFDSSVILGTEDQERIQEMTTEAQFGELWRVDSDERFGNTEAQRGVFDMLEKFRRCDCAIQAVDIGGLRAGTVAGGTALNRASGQDGLFIMADQTGGEFFRNYNDLSVAMEKLLDRTSVTYLLTLAPEGVAFDGGYHPIEVKVKGAPKGADVHHRPGFYAPRSYAEMSPEERTFATAERILGGEVGGEIPTSVLATPFPGDDRRAYVSAFIEIDGFALRERHQGRRLPLELFAYAIATTGAATDYFTEGILLDLEQVGGALDARGFKFVGHFDLGPGDYEVRVLVRNAATGSSGLASVQLSVPDFSTGLPTVSPPLFIEPDGLWLVGTERSGQGREVRRPLSSGGRTFVPSAVPILRAGQRAPLMLLARNVVGQELKATGRLLSGSGGEASPVEVALGTRGLLGGAERLAATIQVADVPPGDYRLEVELEPAASAAVRNSIPVIIY